MARLPPRRGHCRWFTAPATAQTNVRAQTTHSSYTASSLGRTSRVGSLTGSEAMWRAARGRAAGGGGAHELRGEQCQQQHGRHGDDASRGAAHLVRHRAGDEPCVKCHPPPPAIKISRVYSLCRWSASLVPISHSVPHPTAGALFCRYGRREGTCDGETVTRASAEHPYPLAEPNRGEGGWGRPRKPQPSPQPRPRFEAAGCGVAQGHALQSP